MSKKTRALIILLGIIIVVLSLILLFRRPQQTPSPSLPVISQSPNKLTPLQKTVIGKTTPDEVEENRQVDIRQTLSSGDLKYSLRTRVDNRPDQIIFHNNSAQFERIVIVGSTTPSATLKLSDQTLKYGPAEKIIKGSKYYGPHMETYIYATRGAAFIANTNADEVYEVQIFTPSSLEDYLKNYGEDILTTKKEARE